MPSKEKKVLSGNDVLIRRKKIKGYLILGSIIILGLFLRVWNIDNTPPGIYPDEAVNGEDALRVVESGNWQWFYPANQGREGLFMNLIAICFKLFGVSILTLKLPAIICGTLTIWGTYLLTKELFKRDYLALIAAFLTSFSFWSINFSRISFRANMLPLVLVFSFYFLWRGMRTKKILDFAVGGFILGIGLHTYIAFRIAPAILFLTLLALIFSYKNFWKKYWKQVLVFTFFTLLAAAPMLYTFFWAHPEYFESRSDSISVLSPNVNQGHLMTTLLRSLGLSLIKYNFWGDQNWRHNFPPYPILDPVTGIAFLAGLIFVVSRTIRLIFSRISKKIPDPKLPLWLFLSSWFFFMLSPEFLTAEGLPHALRSIGTLPVVMILASLTFGYFINFARKHSPTFRHLSYAFLTLLFLFVGFFNSIRYHFVWANRVETARSFDKTITETTDYLRALPIQKEKFVLTGNMERVVMKLFAHNYPYTYYFYPNENNQINPQNPTYFEIIMTEKNDTIIDGLEKKFPGIKLEEKRDRFGLSFYVLKR